MKLFRIFQRVNNEYDTYDSAVVCAPDEQTARRMSPDNGQVQEENSWNRNTWACFEAISAEYLGEAREGMPVGVVVSSFNAG